MQDLKYRNHSTERIDKKKNNQINGFLIPSVTSGTTRQSHFQHTTQQQQHSSNFFNLSYVLVASHLSFSALYFLPLMFLFHPRANTWWRWTSKQMFFSLISSLPWTSTKTWDRSGCFGSCEINCRREIFLRFTAPIPLFQTAFIRIFPEESVPSQFLHNSFEPDRAYFASLGVWFYCSAAPN
jgi:hypothetical protein